MPRALLIALLIALLLVPATVASGSSARLRGTVAAKSQAAHLVSVKASRRVFSLRVPGSLAAIRVGERVELRGSTLRAQRHRSRVLARGVSIVSSQYLTAKPASQTSSTSADDEAEDDELEIKGELTSLAPVTVASSTRTAACAAPAGMSLAGFAVGDLVEMTCDLVGEAWVVRKLEHEDDDASSLSDDDDDHAHSGPGGDDDSSGSHSGDDGGENDD